jgi:hypothetical protein
MTKTAKRVKANWYLCFIGGGSGQALAIDGTDLIGGAIGEIGALRPILSGKACTNSGVKAGLIVDAVGLVDAFWSAAPLPCAFAGDVIATEAPRAEG